MLKKILVLFCALSSFLFNGCQRSTSVVPEMQEPLFQQGQQFLSENRPDDAFKAFERLLDKRHGDGAATHFELGQLYLSHQHDPIFAIYHFRQYLIQDPESKTATLVGQMIETAKKEFARTLPFNDHYNESPEYLNLMELLKQVRSENAQLKKQLAAYKHGENHKIHDSQVVKMPGVIKNTSKERTYMVQNDDSLSKISLKMYGSAVKWKIIYDANKDVLPSPNSLKIGMRLRIPALKK